MAAKAQIATAQQAEQARTPELPEATVGCRIWNQGKIDIRGFRSGNNSRSSSSSSSSGSGSGNGSGSGSSSSRLQ